MAAAEAEEENQDAGLFGSGRKRAAIARVCTQHVRERNRDNQHQDGNHEQSHSHGDQGDATASSTDWKPAGAQHARGGSLSLTDYFTALTGSFGEREAKMRSDVTRTMLALTHQASQTRRLQNLRNAIQALMLEYEFARSTHGVSCQSELDTIVKRLRHAQAITRPPVPAEPPMLNEVRCMNLLLPLVLLNAERPTSGTLQRQRIARLKVLQAC